jgi:hypothetical protein
LDFKINVDDKPNLKKALSENPQQAKEVIQTFVQMMELSFDESNGIRWADLPKELNEKLTFNDLIKGVLDGLLSTRQVNPETFDVMKIEVHPLSILSPRRNYIDGGYKYYNWREIFKLDEHEPINYLTIAKILRKMLRYIKYIDIQTLAEHLQANQITTYRGLGDEQIKRLPFYPAIRYQQKLKGDLQVGKFYDDVGFFDCGTNEKDYCLACNRYDLHKIGDYKVCLACNAGFKGGEDDVAKNSSD